MVQYLSVFVKHHENWESKALWTIQPFQHLDSSFRLFLAFRFPRIVVYVDINEVVADGLGYLAIICNEVGKS